MILDNIVILLRPQSMRLFHKGQSHQSFIPIAYNDESVIDLEFDYTDHEVLIGAEKNPVNRTKYLNPLIDLNGSNYLKNSTPTSNIELLVDAINKILLQYFEGEGRKSFSSIVARSNLCLFYDLGISDHVISILDKKFSSFSYASTSSISSSTEYYLALPTHIEHKILLQSCNKDLFVFYKKEKVEKFFLAGVISNPLIDIICQNIFDHIKRMKSHLHFDFDSNKKNLENEARKLLANKNSPHGSVVFNDGRSYEYYINLNQCELEARNKDYMGPILIAVDRIIKKIGISQNEISIYYSGQSSANEFFDRELRNSYTNIVHIEDFHALDLQLKLALDKITEANASSQISSPLQNETRIDAPPSIASTPPPPPIKGETKTSKAPLPPPPIGKTKPKTTTSTKKKAPPPPPLKATTSPKKTGHGTKKKAPPPPPPAPPKGPMSAKKNVAASGTPPPPPAPPKGPTSAKKKVAASGKKKMAPPPPPPPKRK